MDGNRDAIHLKQKQEYLAVQYLAQLILNNLTNPIAVGEIQWAIWDLTDPGLINQSNNKKILGSEPWGNVSAYLPAIDRYILDGIKNDKNRASWLPIYAPAHGQYGQEYIQGSPEQAQITPEPTSLTLLGTGLLAVAAGLRRKKASRELPSI